MIAKMTLEANLMSGATLSMGTTWNYFQNKTHFTPTREHQRSSSVCWVVVTVRYYKTRFAHVKVVKGKVKKCFEISENQRDIFTLAARFQVDASSVYI